MEPSTVFIIPSAAPSSGARGGGPDVRSGATALASFGLHIAFAFVQWLL